MKTITLTTDGACSPNPGRGGWACLLRYGNAYREISGSSPWSTNNRMELRAIIEGLKALKERCDVTIITDSKIAIAWCRQKKPSKHFPHEMAIELALALAGHKLTFQWVKGHAGHPDNERCDRLAREQRTSPFST